MMREMNRRQRKDCRVIAAKNSVALKNVFYAVCKFLLKLVGPRMAEDLHWHEEGKAKNNPNGIS